MHKTWLQSFGTLIIILLITTFVFLYTTGYRVQRTDDNLVDLTKTGMVSAKSIPKGASVYIDDKIVTATDDTVSGLTPGIHRLKIVRKGFVEWQKDIEVYEQLVTDITAVLVSQSPRLEPLTNTGASFPSISPSYNKLAYFSKDETSPGVWVIPIDQSGISIFKTNQSVVLEDTVVTKYSEGKSIQWSPLENQLLIENANGGFYLVNLETNTAQSIVNPKALLLDWDQINMKKRTDFVSKLDIPDDIKILASGKDILWAPDEKKFLYKITNGTKLQYKVYNMEKPLPIGEKVETLVFETEAAAPQPSLSWYSDSFHLILTEGSTPPDTRGVISLIRIDGSNKTEIYSNTMYSPNVYSAPGGDKIVILTSFKSGDQTDLYTVGIR